MITMPKLAHAFSLAALLMLQACAHIPGGVPAVQRNTTYGAVIGADDSATNGTYSWKGVPFARPPVGELRWLAPLNPLP